MGCTSAGNHQSGARARLLLIAPLLCALSLPAAAAIGVTPGSTSGTHPAAVASDAKEQKPGGWKIVEVVVAIFAVSFGLGAGWGARRSPDFEDSAVIAEYVAKHAKYTPTGEYTKGSTLDGKLTLKPTGIYRFPVGIVTWVYDPRPSPLAAQTKPLPAKVTYDPATDGGLPPMQKKKLTYPQALSMITLVGSGQQFIQAGGQLHEVVNAVTGADKARLIVLSVLAAGSGLVLGYMVGYVEKPNPQSKAFEEQLKDPVFWEVVVNKRRALDGWKFYESQGAILVERLADGIILNLKPITGDAAALPGSRYMIGGRQVVISPKANEYRMVPAPDDAMKGLQAIGEWMLAARLTAQTGYLFGTKPPILIPLSPLNPWGQT